MYRFKFEVSRRSIETFTTGRKVEEVYTKLGHLGQGTFGEVVMAKVNGSEKVVAIKVLPVNPARLRYSSNPMARLRPYDGSEVWLAHWRCMLREVNILQNIVHPNIVRLLEVCQWKFDPNSLDNPLTTANICLVLEYCEFDLAGLLSKNGVTFELAEKKMIMWQLLEGMHAIHRNGIMHRDLKSANILVNRRGEVKLADFGMARAVTAATVERGVGRNPWGYTNTVVSLWYRAPEILLGSTHYGLSIDMWSMGAVMFELWTRLPALAGLSNTDQLLLINRLCGSITPTSMPICSRLRCYWAVADKLPKNLPRILVAKLHTVVEDHNAVKLIDQLLVLNPMDRLTVEEAMAHSFFNSFPRPKPLVEALSRVAYPLHSN